MFLPSTWHVNSIPTKVGNLATGVTSFLGGHMLQQDVNGVLLGIIIILLLCVYTY